MPNTSDSLEQHEELTQYDVKNIRSAAFESLTPILDGYFEDDTLNDLIENYEQARETLDEEAAAIASYCNIDSHA